MALRSGKSKSGGKEPNAPRLGAVRRTQLITTYGVGSMIAFGDQSYLVSGLDSWKVDRVPDVREFRLETRLGLRKGFFLPPAADPPAGDGVRVRRFPDMYTCPGRDPRTGQGCEHNLGRYGDFNPPRGSSECAACAGPLTPSRFIVACERGHLDDFPYDAWVHGRPLRANERPDHRLSFHTTGRTAALRSIVVRCSCGMEASMEGAFGRGALESVHFTCFGKRPWLGRGADEGCGLTPRTMQRGSSAAWFPVVRSALSIPPFSERLYDEILGNGRYDMWKGETVDTIVRQATKAGLLDDYTREDVVRAVRDYEAYEAGDRPDPSTITGFEPADVLRREEYRQLHRESRTQHFESVRPEQSRGTPAPPGIADTMLVTRLREVRTLQTFTRVDPPMAEDSSDRLAALSEGDVGWLPAVEVVGEGVFLSLDGERLGAWESSSSEQGEHPPRRAERIHRHHQDLLDGRARKADRSAPQSQVDARLVLVHTLAHALINEWNLDAGYPASALRERLYVSDEMAGLLIYTATSDSAGSLGGLVGQGEPERLRRSLGAALRRISWCSADPLCMESEASGADSLNLAACHACMLVPETSCEMNNCFLDRAMLIGTPGGETKGYFEEFMSAQ